MRTGTGTGPQPLVTEDRMVLFGTDGWARSDWSLWESHGHEVRNLALTPDSANTCVAFISVQTNKDLISDSRILALTPRWLKHTRISWTRCVVSFFLISYKRLNPVLMIGRAKRTCWRIHIRQWENRCRRWQRYISKTTAVLKWLKISLFWLIHLEFWIK